MAEMPDPDLLRERMAICGLSVSQACRDAGLSTDWFWQWSKGRRDPRLSFVRRIVRVIEKREKEMGITSEDPAAAGDSDGDPVDDVDLTPDATPLRVNKELVGWSWPTIGMRLGMTQLELTKLMRGDVSLTPAQEHYLATVAAMVASVPLPTEFAPTAVQKERSAIRAFRQRTAAALAAVYMDVPEGAPQDALAAVAEMLDLVDEVTVNIQAAIKAAPPPVPAASATPRQPFLG
jgi:transcriptional regulator with XRE-family HTH domain